MPPFPVWDDDVPRVDGTFGDAAPTEHEAVDVPDVDRDLLKRSRDDASLRNSGEVRMARLW